MQAPDTKAPLPAIDFPAMEALRNAQTQAYQAMLVRMRAAMDKVLDGAPGQVAMQEDAAPHAAPDHLGEKNERSDAIF